MCVCTLCVHESSRVYAGMRLRTCVFIDVRSGWCYFVMHYDTFRLSSCTMPHQALQLKFYNDCDEDEDDSDDDNDLMVIMIRW